MDDQKLLPPLARGDSKRANLDKLSILDLPAELRNQIYSYLLNFHAPLDIYHERNRLDENGRLQMRLGCGVRIPVALFASCRTLYREAVSAFYSGNTFAIGLDGGGILYPIPFSRGYNFPMGSNSYYSPSTAAPHRVPIELPGAFFAHLGTQACWLKKIVLDLMDLPNASFYKGSSLRSLPENIAHDDGLALFKITPVLRAIWSIGRDIDFSFTHSKRLPILGPSGLACNAPAMSAMVRSILEGQLRLRTYGRLLCVVALDRNGAGGIVGWGTTNPISSDASPTRGQICADMYFVSSFIAKDGGHRLEMGKREKPLNLLDFPRPLLDRILNMVVHPSEGYRVNLGKDNKINCGLIHVNRKLHKRWRDEVLFRDNRFELVLTTDCARTDFDQFKHLRRSLRKTYDTRTTYVETRTLVAGGYLKNKMRYTLKFEANDLISLSEVRINILPLIMETSTTRGDDTVTIEVWARNSEGISSLASSHTLTLHELRVNIAAVMMKNFYLTGNKLVPDFWINGFGEVVQVEDADEKMPVSGGAWEPASEFTDFDGQGFKVSRLHPIDVHYRGNETPSRPVVHFVESQFFPFRREVKEILPYLIKSIETTGGPYRDMFSRSMMTQPFHYKEINTELNTDYGSDDMDAVE
ncbi:uncharacterized protein J4E79_010230 [Alternaria viburni]|uniref:uncharacterized protein n=1 Tax=Alternaria viburni TaxID=566460 RepID=UPI0020C25E12|nr:uncharacterized protein J4E79_010230 [Alternaria viburni]KAI4647372.1 hypothetical protein J4E79_010230 [Alternaria viburni]